MQEKSQKSCKSNSKNHDFSGQEAKISFDIYFIRMY